MSLNTTPGDPAADSYASFAEYTAYCTARGITPSVQGTAEIELRKGTAYLDNQYRGKWIGVRTNETQSLAWPRSDGNRDLYRPSFLYPLLDMDRCQIGVNIIPTPIKSATIEAALLVKGGTTTLEPIITPEIKSIGKSVGPLRKDIVYADGASLIDRYTVIEGLLRGYVTGTPGSGAGNVELVRA